MRRAKTPDRSPPREIGAVQPLYTIPQLAALAKTSRFRMARLLDTHRIEVVRSGRSVLVPISELEAKIPQLLEAIETAARVQKRIQQK